jgi:hypothetical protein
MKFNLAPGDEVRFSCKNSTGKNTLVDVLVTRHVTMSKYRFISIIRKKAKDLIERHAFVTIQY